MRARKLLERASTLYDDPQLPFASMAVNKGWRTGFNSGAAWMQAAMEHIRQTKIPTVPTAYNGLGVFKYGLATLGALSYGAVMVSLGWWWLLPGVVLVFYALEAQMVFLFPLAIDGCPTPFQTARSWTLRAGGTWQVMVIVMQLAVVMLFGGLLGKGFVRSWALGCMAIVLWYEELRCAVHRVA